VCSAAQRGNRAFYVNAARNHDDYCFGFPVFDFGQKVESRTVRQINIEQDDARFFRRENLCRVVDIFRLQTVVIPRTQSGIESAAHLAVVVNYQNCFSRGRQAFLLLEIYSAAEKCSGRKFR